MTERYLITSYKIEDGKVQLWPKGLRYAELILFDVSDLQEAGIDWENAEQGERIPCRFWANYTLSDKTKSTGARYKDVVSLEPIDLPATTTSTDTSAMLEAIRLLTGEIQAIKALLAHLAQGKNTIAQDSPSIDPPAPTVADEPAPTVADEPATNDLKAGAFFTATVDALAAQVPTATIDALTLFAGTHGYITATTCLKAAIARAALPHKQRTHHGSLVARIQELLATSQVKTGLVPDPFEPGWQWLLTNDELIEAGKTLSVKIKSQGGRV